MLLKNKKIKTPHQESFQNSVKRSGVLARNIELFGEIIKMKNNSRNFSIENVFFCNVKIILILQLVEKQLAALISLFHVVLK